MSPYDQKREKLNFIDLTVNPFSLVSQKDLSQLESLAKRILNTFSNLKSKYNIKGKHSTTESYTNRYDVTGLASADIMNKVNLEMDALINSMSAMDESGIYEQKLREAVSLQEKQVGATRLLSNISVKTQKKLQRTLYNSGINVTGNLDGSTEIVIPSNTKLKKDGKDVNAVRHIKKVIQDDIDSGSGGPIHRIYDALGDSGRLSKKDLDVAKKILDKEALAKKEKALRRLARLEIAKKDPSDPESARIIRREEKAEMGPAVVAATFKGTEEEKEKLKRQEEAKIEFARAKREALYEWARKNPDTIEAKRIRDSEKKEAPLHTIGAKAMKVVAAFLIVKTILNVLTKIYNKMSDFGASIRNSFLEAQRASLLPSDKRYFDQLNKTTGINMVPYISSVGKLTRGWVDGTGSYVLEKSAPLVTLQNRHVMDKLISQIEGTEKSDLRDTAETILGSTLLSVLQGKSIENRREGAMSPNQSFVKLAAYLERIFPGSGDALGGLFALYQNSSDQTTIRNLLEKGKYRDAFAKITSPVEAAGAAGSAMYSPVKHGALYDASLAFKETGALFEIIAKMIKSDILLSLHRVIGLLDRVALFIARALGAEDVVRELSDKNIRYNQGLLDNIPSQKNLIQQTLIRNVEQFKEDYPHLAPLADKILLDPSKNTSRISARKAFGKGLPGGIGVELLGNLDYEQSKRLASLLSMASLYGSFSDYEKALRKQLEKGDQGRPVHAVTRTSSVMSYNAIRDINHWFESYADSVRNKNLSDVTQGDLSLMMETLVNSLKVNQGINMYSVTGSTGSGGSLDGTININLHVTYPDGETSIVPFTIMDNGTGDADLELILPTVGSEEHQ